MADLFRVTVDPLELVVRGTLMYWFLLQGLEPRG